MTRILSGYRKGSTFTVTLKHKIADENYYVKNYAENPETYSEILKDRKILLAEDNDLNAEIAEAILERAGLKTERVEDGIHCQPGDILEYVDGISGDADDANSK